MCTVTFLACKHGYALGMNRDEKKSRAAGLPPRLHELGGRKVLAPTEASGGMWISLNDAGVCCALINWHSVTRRADQPAASRGEVVRAAAAADDEAAVRAALKACELARTNPFRLITIVPEERAIMEWRWDLRELAEQRHPWETRQWISSGFDEARAQVVRSAAFQARLAAANDGSVDENFLRALHASHEPERGPFSTCMHREDARTVSYTEVTVRLGAGSMRHAPGSLCEAGASLERLDLLLA